MRTVEGCGARGGKTDLGRCSPLSRGEKPKGRNRTQNEKLLTSGEFPCPTAHIEKKLFLSRSTVQTYRMHLYQKLDIRNRHELLDIIEAADAG